MLSQLCLAALWLPVTYSHDDVFVRHVAPILEHHCLGCHNAVQAKGGLSLATREGLLAGGSKGPAIVPGNPTESTLLDAITGAKPRMPKGKPALSRAQAQTLRAWIEQGAVWPPGARLIDKSTQADAWWAWQPLTKPAPPREPQAANPIDAFWLARLKLESLKPSLPADRRTLARRLFFDLHGLPPTPEEQSRFLADSAPDAYERLVDRLLASPRYGERWARHWLDVAHYGDTHGYDKDKVRPNAWPYRDYVVRALNADIPFSRFVQEQLAGDVQSPNSSEAVTALGFLAAGPWDFVGQVELREGTLDKRITRNLDRDDMVATVMNTFTSLTVQCARCHDHKFDPIKQEDYYRLQAVFAAIDRADRPIPNAAPGMPKVVYAAASDFGPSGSFIPTKGKPRPIHVLDRGSEKTPRQEVAPGSVHCAVGLSGELPLPAGHSEGQRRLALAQWLTDSRNPLTWRSIVNRLWLYHFGRGLVDTPNDFGHMGTPPTHPDLLDWLAASLRDGNQSLKDLHRLIVLSRAYRQSSAHDTENSARDAGNRFLWRANRRRLEAEAVRDAVLAVSGSLRASMYGPGFRLFAFQDDHSPRYRYEELDPDDPATHRRSLYRFIVRSVPDPFMETLDCADPSLIVEKRNETLTALQALALLNNRFMLRMADRFAARLSAEAATLTGQVDQAMLLSLGRLPTEEERAVLLPFARREGLPALGRLLFNANEFCFVD